MSFPVILDQHVHDYYKNKSMQQIYEYNVFPVVQDQIRYNGETNPLMVVADRIPSTTPGAEPPRDARDSGSARSRSMHLETSSSDRP